MATPLYSYMLGSGSSGSGAMVNLESMTPPVDAPQSLFHPYSQMLPLGDGTVRGGGWITATWTWDIIPDNQRDQLRTFCPLASADVWIKTKTMDSAESYAVLRGIMIWPIENETRDQGQFHPRTKFEIKFQRLA